MKPFQFACIISGFMGLYSPFACGQLLVESAEPIHIQSDAASFESATRQAHHEGHVVMKQGQHTLEADKLTIIRGKDDKSTLHAIGAPAIFIGTLKGEKMPLRATARSIKYYPEDKLLILEDNAEITHIHDIFRGPMLSYQLDKQVVKAEKRSDERPTITIAPRVKQKS